MKKTRRKILITVMVIFLLLFGGCTYLYLIATDTITFTKKIYAFETRDNRIIEIYRTAYFEYYECSFSVKNGERVLLSKIPFYTTRYLTIDLNGQTVATPEERTAFKAVVGITSGIVGIVNAFVPQIVEVLYNFQTNEYWDAGTRDEGKKGQSMLEILQADLPKTQYVLGNTKAAAEIMSNAIDKKIRP